MTMFQSLVSEVQDAATSRSTERHVRALTRMTDLFLAGSARYSERQVELFGEVFKVLVEVIEFKTRVKLSERFAVDPNTPSALARAFAASDAAAVAAPMLSQSTALAESDLIASARTQSQDHLYAIAQRRSVSEAVTDILIERGERRVIHAVANNEGAGISDGGFGRLVQLSDSDVTLALRIGARRDIPRHHFVKLLESASADVCRKIIVANPKLADIVQETVTEVVDGINGDARKQSQDHVNARSRVKRLREWRDLKEGDVHAAARAQDFERTVAALSILAGCPIELAERAVLNANPGPLQVVAKAAGCSWATAKTLLLMEVADRRMSKSDIDRARVNFDALEWATAKRVLEFYEARRNAQASLPIAAGQSAEMQALAG
jgi:uncharacterized protein (DUF2336 family)